MKKKKILFKQDGGTLTGYQKRKDLSKQVDTTDPRFKTIGSKAQISPTIYVPDFEVAPKTIKETPSKIITNHDNAYDYLVFDDGRMFARKKGTDEFSISLNENDVAKNKIKEFIANGMKHKTSTSSSLPVSNKTSQQNTQSEPVIVKITSVESSDKNLPKDKTNNLSKQSVRENPTVTQEPVKTKVETNVKPAEEPAKRMTTDEAISLQDNFENIRFYTDQLNKYRKKALQAKTALDQIQKLENYKETTGRLPLNYNVLMAEANSTLRTLYPDSIDLEKFKTAHKYLNKVKPPEPIKTTADSVADDAKEYYKFFQEDKLKASKAQGIVDQIIAIEDYREKNKNAGLKSQSQDLAKLYQELNSLYPTDKVATFKAIREAKVKNKVADRVR